MTIQTRVKILKKDSKRLFLLQKSIKIIFLSLRHVQILSWANSALCITVLILFLAEMHGNF
ncbi:MAG: hypothetical protein DPW21_00595 [Anaerolineae bacterium]|nr:hypothetical protein [Anaerolineae bacterium]